MCRNTLRCARRSSWRARLHTDQGNLWREQLVFSPTVSEEWNKQRLKRLLGIAPKILKDAATRDKSLRELQTKHVLAAARTQSVNHQSILRTHSSETQQRARDHPHLEGQDTRWQQDERDVLQGQTATTPILRRSHACLPPHATAATALRPAHYYGQRSPRPSRST